VELEHDERVLHGTGWVAPFAGTLAATAVLVLIELPRHLLFAVGILIPLFLVHLTAIAYSARRVLVTTRRVVEFRPALAALARRVPRLARLERSRRRAIDLLDVVTVRASGIYAVVHTTDDERHMIATASETEAARLMLLIDRSAGEARRAYEARREAERRAAAVANAVRVGSDTGAVARDSGRTCPYCRDAVDADRDAACGACGAVHHEDCLAIHGGCAVMGCRRAGSPRRARERAGG